MEKNLADLIDEISRAGKTGMLSISIQNDESLLKIFFRKGIIYYITYGSCRNMECIGGLSSLATRKGFFMPDARVETTQTVSVPTPEIIARVRAMAKSIQWEGRVGEPERAPAQAVSGSGSVLEAGALAVLVEELVNLVGPVGAMLLEQACMACGIKSGDPVTKHQFHILVQTVSKLLSDEHQALLVSKFKA